ncbi:MAG: aminoglycoside phosphotransferase family protein [Anaerolineales bacterium]|nr:aminoglycoside phosphotransferase family protein [Anaerolineales bacterium]
MDAQEISRAFSKWPFTQSELTAGLRRHACDPRLAVTRIAEREITRRLPAVGRLRGVEVHTQGINGKSLFHLVLKENMGSTRTGGAGAGLREINVYLTLKELLPVRLPVLVTAHPKGAWLLLIHLPPGRLPHKWRAADYLLAVEQLAILHDRFWGLGDDLAVYPWLAQSLHRRRDIYLQAAAKDAETLFQNEASLLTTQTNVMEITEKILANCDQIADLLEKSPATLLHGDYWPGNILIHQQGGITIYDWEDAGIGPAVLDLLSFIQSSSWQFNQLPLPASEITAHYRNQLAQAGAYRFTDDEFNHLWDHALMWTFITSWLGRLAKTPNSLLPLRLEALQEVLFTPINQAVERQLN